MKKFVYTLFIAFWASIGTLVTVHALSSDGPEASAAAVDELPVYSLEDIAAHNTLDDCWMAMEGKVYDFTEYIPKHPTPPAIMEAWCGKEATEGMRTKGYGRDHSEAAWQMAEAYLIGMLKEE